MYDAQKTEDEVLAFWRAKEIYRKSKKKNSDGKKFYFTDGPPYATGHIHMGTALNKIMKDVAMRTRRLQGQDVFDRPGYDTHGLPIEFQVEKEIGSKSKKDIEQYGVEKFIDKCKAYATQYIGVMNKEFENLGIWMDWANPYLTLADEYIEAVWFILKHAYEKNLLYLDKYPVHACTRCETAVAFNEIEYSVEKDRSAFVKFPLKSKKGHLIIWSTTPWTFPANVAVMVHPDVTYAEIETSEGERWFMAEPLVGKRMNEFGIGYRVIRTLAGKEMVGWEYDNPLQSHLQIKLPKRHVVAAPRYVTVEDGTGLVHCAPGHGKEDYEVGQENKLETLSPVSIAGILGPETGKYAGKKAREVNLEIIEDLKKDGFLVHDHVYSHDYPHCWRCKTPLLVLAQPQWLLRINDIKDKLLKESDSVKWAPHWAASRMKAWLSGISNWPISRERYWGTPLPIWRCETCSDTKVIGSRGESRKLAKVKEISMHKPEIDKITFPCVCKKGTMKRVAGVFDVWFDSGVSSWAALNYPAEKKLFEKFWPADLNIEGTDQFRGWWNSQLILSMIAFGKKPFEAINVHGLVLDISKRKMSKSLGNVIAPQEVIAKYGRDFLRYYFVKFSRGEDFSYNEKDFSEIQKVVGILLNVHSFVNQLNETKNKVEIEDEWILSVFNRVVKEATVAYNQYKFHEALDKIEKFLVEDLSRTYIQLIRDRADETRSTLTEIHQGLLKLFAPIMPFLTEKLWQDIRVKKEVEEESVHLSLLPKAREKKINEKLENNFASVKKILEKGLAERDKSKIGVRWPLSEITIKVSFPAKEITDFDEIIMRQLNVKKVSVKTAKNLESIEVALNTEMTPELEGEGFAREIARRVQAERKNRGLEKKDRISLLLGASEKLEKLLLVQAEFIKTRTGSEKIEITNDENLETSFSVREEKVGISFQKIS